MREHDLSEFDAEARKLREIARCAQASVLEAVGMARRANSRATQARVIVLGALAVAFACVGVTFIF